jgi:hypothetical protein
MAQLIPFPLAARSAFIERHTEIALTLSPDGAARHVLRQVREQCAVLERRGVEAAVVAAEGRELAVAFRQRFALVGLALDGAA